MRKQIALLAGDGIGPEVMTGAVRVIEKACARWKHNFTLVPALIGGAAYEEYGDHFPEQTKEICRQSDAILFGSVGGPIKDAGSEKWRNCEANSILALRKTFQFFANLRPAKVYPELTALCPLKRESVDRGIDILIVRELLGDIYFGEHRRFERDGVRVASDMATYDEQQIQSIGEVAFKAAEKRRGKVVSVDKANVLSTSKLWREVMHEVGSRYPHVQYEDMLVDNCSMQLIRNPSQFDVIVTSNLFGDILSDAAAMLPGSLGLTPSASINSEGFGLYEPSGGSAPDIAGKGIANPSAQILSAAMMFRYSFNLEEEALAIEEAVSNTLRSGMRTADLCVNGDSAVTTEQFVVRILENL